MAAILAVAAWLRLRNLGTFSLWLDEVFTMTIAAGPLSETLAASAADAENVPMYAVIANLGLKLGADEISLRVAPIAAGLASIVLLAVWTRRHFGVAVSLITAAFCALSVFHLRYSQELRAYPYLLLVCTLTLLAADRVRRAPDWRSTLLLAAVVAAGCYTHLTYVLALVPAAGCMVLDDEASGVRSGGRRRALARYLAGISLGVLAFGPWIWWISRNLVRRMPQNWTSDWSWKALGSRWQVLTVAGREYERINWVGFVLAGIAIVGLAVALRSRAGRAVLVPALATLLAWELLLVGIDHWSVGRYDTALWPFLAILVALGFHRLLVGMRLRWLQVPTAVAVVAMFVPRLESYYRDGRPHWDALARTVIEVRLPGEPVLASDHWTRTCLSYYLEEDVATMAEHRHRLARTLREHPSVLLASRKPFEPGPDIGAGASDEIINVRRTARLYRVHRD